VQPFTSSFSSIYTKKNGMTNKKRLNKHTQKKKEQEFYETVTDFAKFLGQSTSYPRRTAK